MIKNESKQSNIKEELDSFENSKSSRIKTQNDQNNQKSSNNSKELTNKSKSKEPSEKMEEKKNDSINLFKKTSSSKNNSSKRLNQRYGEPNKKNGNNKITEKENDNEEINVDYKGKFMQINPHFNIFNKQINSLRDSIYDDTKRCLILKGSLQQSSNFLKEESSGLIKDIVEQIYNLRELFEKGNKGLNQTTQEVQEGLKKLKNTQSRARKEIINCDQRITQCEDQIGYKLLGSPSYSFLKKIKDRKSITDNKDENKENNDNI